MDRNEAMKCVMRYLVKNDGVTIDAEVKEALQTLVPELKENEDERIRKVLVSIVKWLGFDSSFFIDNSVTKNEVLAWLEKQKEQKPDENVTDEEINQAMDDIHNFKVAVTDLAKTFNIRIDHDRDIDWHNFCASLLTCLKRHAEWSEKDESYLQTVINEMEANKKEAREYEHKKYDAIILWLKSLLSRPKPFDYWVPTEEQLHALYLASYGGELSSEDCLELDSLLIDLKKLYSL